MSATPCATCPYRRSTPLGIWHRSEYDNLREQDGREFGGSVFGCHLDDGSLCRGWLADQKRRGVPSISLRMRLIKGGDALAAFESVDEADPDLYGSIAEMCAANDGAAFPEKTRAARKLLRHQASKARR